MTADQNVGTTSSEEAALPAAKQMAAYLARSRAEDYPRTGAPGHGRRQAAWGQTGRAFLLAGLVLALLAALPHVDYVRAFLGQNYLPLALLVGAGYLVRRVRARRCGRRAGN